MFDEKDGLDGLRARGFTVTFLPERKAEHKAYAEFMAEELKKIPYEKKTNTEQFESTKRLLALSDDEAAARRAQLTDPKYWQELYEKAQIAKTPEEMDQYLREISPEEYNVYKQMQRGSKNELGQSMESISSDEQKLNAKNAWLYTPGKKLEELTEREKQLIKKEKKNTDKELLSVQTKDEWVELSPIKAFIHWITGGEVKKDQTSNRKSLHETLNDERLEK